MPARIEVRGITGFVANLHAYSRSVGTAVRAAVRQGGEDVEDLARQLAPVDTGRLRASIRTEYSEGGLTFRTGCEPAAFPGTYYPPFVEFGTSVSPAQPFLFPAFEAVRPHFVEDVKAAIRGAESALRGRAA